MVFLHELKQVLVWSNSLVSSTVTFLSSRYYSHGSTFCHSFVCKKKFQNNSQVRIAPLATEMCKPDPHLNLAFFGVSTGSCFCVLFELFSSDLGF